MYSLALLCIAEWRATHICCKLQFCWVVDERITLRGERAPEQYVPWGYNSDLELFNGTADGRHAAGWRRKVGEPTQGARQNVPASVRTRGGQPAAAAAVPTTISSPADVRLSLEDEAERAQDLNKNPDTAAKRTEELMEMKRLFEAELIDKAEYKEQKKAILARYS